VHINAPHSTVRYETHPVAGATGASVSALVQSGEDPFVGYLHVRNKPRIGSSQANDVHVRLQFCKAASGEPIRSLMARWAFTSQSEGYEATQLAPQVDVPANGVPYKLDVVVKFADDPQCYGVDDRSRHIGWKAYPLGTDPVVVEVQVRGSNAKLVTALYDLARSGAGSDVQLVPAARPRDHLWSRRK
jgi:hypothetical protein